MGKKRRRAQRRAAVENQSYSSVDKRGHEQRALDRPVIAASKRVATRSNSITKLLGWSEQLAIGELTTGGPAMERYSKEPVQREKTGTKKGSSHQEEREERFTTRV